MRLSVFFLLMVLAMYHQLVFSQSPGSLDLTFDQDGLAFLQPGQSNALGRDLLEQPDGKIIVGGISNQNGSTDFSLIRLNATGQPDSTFGQNGVVNVDFNALSDILEGIALDREGRIVAAGYVETGDGFAFGICRYLPDGTPDLDFGTQGKVQTKIGTTGFCKDVAVMDNNRIVVGGYALDPIQQTNVMVAVRYLENGTLDSTFNGTGVVKINTGIGAGVSNALQLQADGSIFLAGQSLNDMTFRWEMCVVKLDKNGAPDNSWDEDGVVFLQNPDHDFTIQAIAIQQDQKILIGGLLGTAPSNNRFALARFNVNGSQDADFGDHGLVINTYGMQNNQIYGVAVQPDQRILIGGGALSGNREHFALARLETDGSFDMSFGNGGKVITSPGLNDGIEAIALQSDGKLIVAGESFEGTRFDIVVARYETGLMTAVPSPVNEIIVPSVFPNPATTQITIIIPGMNHGFWQVALYDNMGREVLRLPMQPTTSGEELSFTINLPDTLPSGIYYLSARDQTTVYTASISIAK